MRILDASRVAVFGLGTSGVAAANLLASHGIRVLASDPRQALADQLGALSPQVEVRLGENSFEGCDVIVSSPGLPPSLPIFDAARAARVPIRAEVALAYEVARAPFVAITGTDGKTTTTSLTGDIFAAAGVHTVVAGNIGTPLCEVVAQVPAQGVIVAEISAFQLWSAGPFRARAAGITNVAADHLDYFQGDMRAYAEAKRLLLANATSEDCAVLNAHDAEVSGWGRGYPGRVIRYGLGADPDPSAPDALWSDGERFFARLDGAPAVCWLEALGSLPLQGPHQQLNMLCAAGLASARGVSLEVVARATRAFEPLPHRMQRVLEHQGVTFWDDSKATNAHAAMAGLRGVSGPLVTIVGGVDKGLDLAPMSALLCERASHVLLIGAIAARWRAQLEAQGYDPGRMHEVTSMEDAVQQAFALAKPEGASVTLSPACSSFDMFQSYAHRGRAFQAAVRLIDRADSGAS